MCEAPTVVHSHFRENDQRGGGNEGNAGSKRVAILLYRIRLDGFFGVGGSGAG